MMDNQGYTNEREELVGFPLYAPSKVPCGAKGDSLMRKPAIPLPRSASGPRLISHVTLRQDQEPVKVNELSLHSFTSGVNLL